MISYYLTYIKNIYYNILFSIIPIIIPNNCENINDELNLAQIIRNDRNKNKKKVIMSIKGMDMNMILHLTL